MSEVNTSTMLRIYQTTQLGYVEIGKQLGVSAEVVRGRLRRLFKEDPSLNFRGDSSDGSISLTAAMSESEFLRPFDWKSRLRIGLENLVPGSKSAVIRDDDFRRHLSIPQDKWRRLKRLDEFKPYQLSINGAIYWCQPQTGVRLRSEIELAEEVM